MLEKDYFPESPATSLPEGWKWVDCVDGTGFLESPQGAIPFIYDENISVYADYKGAYDNPLWKNFNGKNLDEIKLVMEKVILSDMEMENVRRPNEFKQKTSIKERISNINKKLLSTKLPQILKKESKLER